MTKYRIVNDVLISGSGTIGMRLASIQRLAQQKGEQDHNNRASVILCTLNGSKGLQWPKVWIIDVEKGRAPARYKGDPEDEEAQDAHLEEERRLVYVGMTRAEQTLVLSYREGKSSIFIDEIRGYEGEE
jgi:ATP-dependent DNA helicase Rep